MATDLSELESRLWSAADQLWANTGLKPSEFSTPVLGLIFLRYADQRFHDAGERFKKDGLSLDEVDKTDYQAEGVLYLKPEARFSHLLGLAEGADLGRAINNAMADVEVENPDLKGVLPRSFNKLENKILVELLRLLAPVKIDGDAFGKVYEYFLGKFALKEGQKGGVFYTPESIVKLIVEIIEPYHGRVFDPACGSGGMFVHSAAFVQRHHKSASDEIAIYGTEKASDTVKLAKMNLAVHGLSGDIREANTYYEDPHQAQGRFDFVMANPPFNVSSVDRERVNDNKRFPFGIPAGDNANYLWIQLFYSSLNDTGRAGFVMHNSASDSDFELRKRLIDEGVVDVVILTSPNLFYTVSLPCTLWFLDKRKRNTERANEILFIDARKVYRQVDSVIREITDEQIRDIASLVKSYRGESETTAYKDIAGLCKKVSLDDVRNKDYSLNPKLYVDHLGHAANDELKDELLEIANNQILRIKAAKKAVLPEFGRDIPLDRDVLLSFASVVNVHRFKGWTGGPPLRELISSYIGGTWGQESPDEAHTEAVRVIRGTDMPAVIRGELAGCPVRYVKPSQLKSRRISHGDIVLEVSGGGKEVTTGRNVIITEALIAGSSEPLVCASFCKLLRVNTEKINPWILYLFLQHIYAHGVMGKYEVQSTGIKNFQTETFLDEVRADISPLPSDDESTRSLFELVHEVGLSVDPLKRIALYGGCDASMLEFDPL